MNAGISETINAEIWETIKALCPSVRMNAEIPSVRMNAEISETTKARKFGFDV